MPLMKHKSHQSKPRHRLHCAARMNSFAAKAKAVRAELSSRIGKSEAQVELGNDAAEVQRFVTALGVFIDTVTPK